MPGEGGFEMLLPRDEQLGFLEMHLLQLRRLGKRHAYQHPQLEPAVPANGQTRERIWVGHIFGLVFSYFYVHWSFVMDVGSPRTRVTDGYE